MVRLILTILLSAFGLAGAGPSRAQEAVEAPRIVMVTHGQPSDRFWSIVKSGADQAAEDFGVVLDYRAPDTFDLNEMAVLIEEAIDEAPDGLVVSIPNADALAPQIRRAVNAGIPVISINSGFDIARSLGVELHVGQNEYDAGRVAGQKMRELGGRRALCVNHEIGNIGLDLRCKGFIDGFEGSVEVLPVERDPAALKAALVEKLTEEETIDVILALSAATTGEAALAAVQETGRADTVRIGTFDVSDAMLRAVADGRAAFAVDQQPFLQGYLPVQFLALLERDGVIPVSDVSSGPRLLTAAEARERLGPESEAAAASPPGRPVAE